MSKFCIKCGNQLSDETIFCQKCGVRQPPESIPNSIQSAIPSAQEEGQKKNSDIDITQTYEGSRITYENPIDILRAKANTPIDSPKKSKKKIIVAIALITVVLGGGTGGYFFLSQNSKDKPLKTESIIDVSSEEVPVETSAIDVDNTGISIGDDNSGVDDNDDAKNVNEWNTEETYEPNFELDMTSTKVNNIEVKKYNTGININQNTLREYFQLHYSPEQGYEVGEKMEENVYAKFDTASFTGATSNYNLIVRRSSDKQTVVEVAYTRNTARFEGTPTLKMSVTSSGTMSDLQDECFEDLKQLMPEANATFLCYGAGQDSDDLAYNYEMPNINIKVSMSREIKTNDDDSITATFTVSYSLINDTVETDAYTDKSKATVYDNAAIKVNSFIKSKFVDYNSANKFLSDVMSKAVIQSNKTTSQKVKTVDKKTKKTITKTVKKVSTVNHKFVDTKLDSLKVIEVREPQKVKDTYSFNVLSSFKEIGYNKAPYMECRLEATKDTVNNTYSDITTTIKENLRGVKDTKTASKIINKQVLQMFPKITKKDITADLIYKSLNKKKTFKKTTTVTILGVKKKATIVAINKKGVINWYIQVK